MTWTSEAAKREAEQLEMVLMCAGRAFFAHSDYATWCLLDNWIIELEQSIERLKNKHWREGDE